MFRDLKPYPEYAEPRSPWIPAFPSTWSVAPGAGVLQEVRAKNYGLREATVLSLSYGRVIVKSDDKLHGLVPASFEGYQILEPGDVVIRPTDLQNDQTSLRVGAVQDHGIITSAYIGLRPRHIDNWFAFLYLKALDHMKVFYGMGSGLRQSLDFSDFKRLPVPVPAVKEQAAIVTYLAHAHQRINQAIATKRRLIALLQEQRRTIAHEALTRGLNPAAPMKDSGVAHLGQIPAHWEIRRAKDVCEAIIDCKNRTPPFVADGRYTVVRTTCVRSGRFSPKGSYPTDEESFLKWTERGAPRAGDVFFTREAPAGEAALVPDDPSLCMGQRMMYFRPASTEMAPAFMLQALYGPVTQGYITLATNGSTVGHLRLGQVSGLPIVWCPLEEQREIIAYIEVRSTAISDAILRAEREIALLREFRTSLDAQVVTGQLDVRGISQALPPIDTAEAFGRSSPAEDDDDSEEAVADDEPGED